MQSPCSRSNEVNKVKLSLSRSQITSNPDNIPPFLQPGFEFAQSPYGVFLVLLGQCIFGDVSETSKTRSDHVIRTASAARSNDAYGLGRVWIRTSSSLSLQLNFRASIETRQEPQFPLVTQFTPFSSPLSSLTF